MKCPSCKGRGWHVGDCHPQETCGRCDGSGELAHIIEADDGRHKLAAHGEHPEIWLQKPHVATEKTIRAPWGGQADGGAFRCGVCGRFFYPSEVFYLVIFWGQVPQTRYGNFLAHDSCVTPDLIARRLVDEAEVTELYRKHWWANDPEKMAPHPHCTTRKKL